MRKLKRTLITSIAMILVCIISVAATTFAYLHNASEIVENTFTIGKIKLSLDEAKVNIYGKPVDYSGQEVDWKYAPRVLENEYKLMPGRTYVKDPTVRVSDDSEKCVLFLVIYIPPELKEVLYYSSLSGDHTKYIEVQMRKHGWQLDQTYDDPVGKEGEASYEVYIYNSGGAAYPGDVIHIFDSITVKDTATYDQLQKADLSEIKITVYGFQYEGTEDTDADVLWDIIVETFDPFGTNP